MIIVEVPQRTLEDEIRFLEILTEGRESTEVGSFLMGALVALKWMSRDSKSPRKVVAAMLGESNHG